MSQESKPKHVSKIFIYVTFFDEEEIKLDLSINNTKQHAILKALF